VFSPELPDGWVLGPSLLKLSELQLGLFGRRRPTDRFSDPSQRRGDPSRLHIQAVAYHMNDAQLHLRLREDVFNLMVQHPTEPVAAPNDA